MRAENEIQDRIRFLLSAELDREVSSSCARLPCNCRYNHRQPLDIRKEVEGDPNDSYNRVAAADLPIIGLCMIGADKPEQWNGTICEDPIDAQRCTSFELISTRELISERFYRHLKDLDWVATNLPEVYGLLWALGSETMPKLPWWKRLWFRFIRFRPDALVKTNPSNLLE